ncbi:MAG: outer membrane beta-barrel protein [bacterium]|jgi:hypothetical protein
MKSTIKFISLFICLISTAGITEAQDDFFALYHRYLYHETMRSPRAMGMGGAYSALRGHDMGLFGNPATLGWQESYYLHLGGSYEEVSGEIMLQDLAVEGLGSISDAKSEINSGLIGLVVPSEWGGIGLLYHYRNDDADSSTNVVGGGKMIGYKSEAETNQGSVGSGFQMTDQLTLGYRYIYYDRDIYTWSGVIRPVVLATDYYTLHENFEGHNNHFGLQFMVNDQWSVGLEVTYGFGDQNYQFAPGHGTDLVGDSDPETWSVRSGAAWHLLPNLPLLLAADLRYEEYTLDDGIYNRDEELFGVHVGVEYEVIEHLFIRLGYKYEDIDFSDNFPLNIPLPTGTPPMQYIIDENVSYSSYTAGLGYSIGQFNIDYALQVSDTGGKDWYHYIGFGFSF